jgi:hypothetical protein
VVVDEQATLSAQVDRAVHAAIAARRPELEQLIRMRVDAELQELALELVAERFATTNGASPANSNGTAELCSKCGAEPRLPHRTVGRACLRDRQRELSPRHREARRRREAARRAGATPDTDEEPPPRRPATAAPDVERPAIAAGELEARIARPYGRFVDGAELEAWLLGAELATRSPDGLLRATARGLELGGGLE